MLLQCHYNYSLRGWNRFALSRWNNLLHFYEDFRDMRPWESFSSKFQFHTVLLDRTLRIFHGMLSQYLAIMEGFYGGQIRRDFEVTWFNFKPVSWYIRTQYWNQAVIGSLPCWLSHHQKADSCSVLKQLVERSSPVQMISGIRPN